MTAQDACRRPQRVRVGGDLYHGRVPDGAVYVGRTVPGLAGSPYANPHRIGRPCRWCDAVHDQRTAVLAYVADLMRCPDLAGRIRGELAGRDVACWCRTGPCHADVLILVAAGTEPAAVYAAVRNSQATIERPIV